MTVEERAREYTSRIDGAGNIWNKVIEQIEAALRDQVEDCAKKADNMAHDLNRWQWPNRIQSNFFQAEIAEEIAKEIRALAAPIDNNNQEKGD